MTEPDLALAIQFYTVEREDPMQRLIRSIKDEHVQFFAKETLRLVEELKHHTTVLLIGEPTESMQAALWLTKNAQEISYRWSSLRKAAIRWAAFDTEALVILRTKP